MILHRFDKDSLVIGALAGITAKLVQTILGFTVIKIFPTYLNCVRIAAGLILSPDEVMAGGLWPTLLGIQIDFTVGVVIAVITVFLLQRWGYDYYIFKGAVVGIVSWALFYCVLSRLLSGVYPVGSVLYAEIAFFTHLVFGMSLTWSAVVLTRWFNRAQR